MDVSTSASYSDIISTIAMIVAIVAVPASGYFSYHFAIKGERRKEFNAVAEPIMMSLMEQIQCIDEGGFPRKYVKINEINKLIYVSKKDNRSKIVSDYKAYDDAMVSSGIEDRYGKFTYHSEDSKNTLRAAIQAMSKNVERQ